MRLFVNALAASAGGGLTYIRNLIPQLATQPGVHVIAALPHELCRELRSFRNIEYMELRIPAARRFWYEQTRLASLVQRCKADVLLSAGNFALYRSPVPQILLSRNSIYTSADFYQDLLSRHEYGHCMDTRFRGILAKKSVMWADVTVAPSEAFAEALRRWTNCSNVVAIHHGFDRQAFTCDSTPLPASARDRLQAAAGSLKLLFVSHYNYYRNFETLIRAMPLIRQLIPDRKTKLLLTCELKPGKNPGTYRPERVAQLIKDLNVSDLVVELGEIPYAQLYQVYAEADIYVTAAYTETFAHPLVESMSSGLPVIASDLPVHHEICGDAALYFARFSPEQLAASVADIAISPDLRQRLSTRGMARSADFSWRKHVDELLALAESLVADRVRIPA